MGDAARRARFAFVPPREHEYVVAEMCRVLGSAGSLWDNAPTESLMGTIKSECVHAKTYRDREQAAPGIFEHMECFHDRLRLHSALGYMSPCEFEEAFADQPLAA